MPSIMNCPKCQADLQAQSSFCPFCGSRLSNVITEEDSGIREKEKSDSEKNHKYARGKNPTTAAMLSIIPGLGQIYNGDTLKGILILLGVATVISFPILLVWSVIDAYQVAKGNWRLWQ